MLFWLNSQGPLQESICCMKTKWRVSWVATPAVGLCSNPQNDPGSIMPPKLPGAGWKPVVPAGESTSPCSQARSMASSTSDSLGWIHEEPWRLYLPHQGIELPLKHTPPWASIMGKHPCQFNDCGTSMTRQLMTD